MANKLQFEKKAAVVSLLCEGSSIRAVERITGVNQNTIMSLGRRVGDSCRALANEKMRGLSSRHIEVDEIWGFVGAKRNNAARVGAYGDVWTFIALDAETKIIRLSSLASAIATTHASSWKTLPAAWHPAFNFLPMVFKPIPMPWNADSARKWISASW
jgi:hypothetical protein